ncbi:MAG: hypothetical protein HKM98_00580 [Gammaproteobacteria bacterium]|nr:hypothetical protein [Gammaproteobacteria bacterium]
MAQGEIQIDGLKELDRKLKSLHEDARWPTLRRALMKSSNPIVKTARNLVSKRSGALARSIGKYSKKGRFNDEIGTVSVGPKRNVKAAVSLYQQYYGKRATGSKSKKKRDGIRHGHLIEFGTKHSPARPFLRPAFHANVTRVVKGFSAELKKSIAKTVKDRTVFGKTL